MKSLPDSPLVGRILSCEGILSRHVQTLQSVIMNYFLKKHCRGTEPARLEGIQRCCPTPHITESSVMDPDPKLVAGSGSEKNISDPASL